MARSQLDSLINFTNEAKLRLANSQEVADLILNERNVAFDPDDLLDKFIYDYDYVDDTVETAGAFVLLDANIERARTATTMLVTLDVFVIVHKGFMTLSPAEFAGMKGTRRDNLMRTIDTLLRDGSNFGIGKLQLVETEIIRVPQRYTGKRLGYQTADFNERAGFARA